MTDRHGHNRYARSLSLLERAERTIPLASQPFSKSRVQFPPGGAPLFLDRGKGGRVWDVDGNEYVDLVAGLLPVVLGYGDEDVDRAISEQLGKGISMSLATELEVDLAERLVEIIPCAEMVRFGKNGTDATSAIVRLARAVTNRERIAVCGYHGWQDWYIGATSRHFGVPQAVRELTHLFPYGDVAALDDMMEKYPGEFALVIMEPANSIEPPAGYLESVRDVAHRHGALLAFDEIITGFRFAMGGAQALFGVTPDLASFGKAMGNGMPISAVCGRADLMQAMEHIFFSGTFGGETLSLAAAIATIDKMRRENAIDTLWSTGDRIAAGVEKKVSSHGLDDIIHLGGFAPWRLVGFSDHATARKEAIKTLFITEMAANGVLLNGSHNICFAHDEEDVKDVLDAYDATLARIAEELKQGGLEDRLPCPAIEPVFAVRADMRPQKVTP